MKKNWAMRIELLEKLSKLNNGEIYFKEWLEKQEIEPSQDPWALLEIVPEGIRLYCLFHIFDKVRQQRAQDSASQDSASK